MNIKKARWKSLTPHPHVFYSQSFEFAYIYWTRNHIFSPLPSLEFLPRKSTFIADYFLHLALVLRFDFFPAGKS